MLRWLLTKREFRMRWLEKNMLTSYVTTSRGPWSTLEMLLKVTACHHRGEQFLHSGGLRWGSKPLLLLKRRRRGETMTWIWMKKVKILKVSKLRSSQLMKSKLLRTTGIQREGWTIKVSSSSMRQSIDGIGAIIGSAKEGLSKRMEANSNWFEIAQFNILCARVLLWVSYKVHKFETYWSIKPSIISFDSLIDIDYL